MFELISKYNPSGDQPEAIEKLVDGIKNNEKFKFYKMWLLSSNKYSVLSTGFNIGSLK